MSCKGSARRDLRAIGDRDVSYERAWSQTGVADAAGCSVAAGSVGTDNGVLVTTDSGSVGVLNGTVLVNCACTVRAAAVNTALASPVGVAAAGWQITCRE